MNHSVSHTIVKDQTPGDLREGTECAATSSRLAAGKGQKAPRADGAANNAAPKVARWMGRMLAVLVGLCLILAAWVWWQILRAMP